MTSKILRQIRKTQSNTDQFNESKSFIYVGEPCEKLNILKFLPDKEEIIPYVTKINTSTWNYLQNFNFTINSHTIDENNNIYITGYFDQEITINSITYSPSTKNCKEIFIARFNIYTNYIDYFITVPGIYDDEALYITLDNNNDIYISGYFTDSITFGSIYLISDENKQFFVAKYNPKIKNWIWAISCYNNTFNSLISHIYHDNKYLYICGYYEKYMSFDTIPKIILQNHDESNNLFYAKINTINGKIIWMKSTIGHNNTNTPTSIFVHNDNIFITGINKNNTTFYKDNKTSLELSNDIINPYILLVSNKGQILEMNTIKCTGNCSINKIKIDKRDNIYLIGSFIHTIYLGKEVYNTNKESIFVSKLYGDKFIWNKIITSDNDIYISDIEFDIQFNIYLLGYFEQNVIYDNEIMKSNSKNKLDIFIAKLNNNGSYKFMKKYINKKSHINRSLCMNINIFGNLFITGKSNEKSFILIYLQDERNLPLLTIAKCPDEINNGDKIEIDFKGKIYSGYENLQPGYNYYIQDDGTIDILSNDYYFGTAISKTKLVIQ